MQGVVIRRTFASTKHLRPRLKEAVNKKSYERFNAR